MGLIYLVVCSLMVFGVTPVVIHDYDFQLTSRDFNNVKISKSSEKLLQGIQTTRNKKSYSAEDDAGCALCVEMVNKVRAAISNNATQQEIGKLLERFCNTVPESLRSQCDEIVEFDIGRIFEVFSSDVDPKFVCLYFGCCQTPVHKSAHRNDFACNQCNSILDMVSLKLSSMDRIDVMHSMQSMCNQLISESKVCRHIIASHFDEIFNYLKVNLNAQSICQRIVCSKFERNAFLQTHRSQNVKDGVICRSCQQVITQARQFLQLEGVAKVVKYITDDFCYIVPVFQDFCSGMVDSLFEPIYNDLLEAMNDPEGFCAMVLLCPWPNADVQKAPLSKRLTTIFNSRAFKPVLDQSRLAERKTTAVDDECEICQKNIADTANEMKNIKTKEQLDEFTKDRCDTEEMCTFILQSIFDKKSPKEICTSCGFCNVELFQAKGMSRSDSECTQCKQSVADFAEYLKTITDKEQQKELIDETCSGQPDEIKEKCEYLLESAFEQKSPVEVCAHINCKLDKHQLIL